MTSQRASLEKRIQALPEGKRRLLAHRLATAGSGGVTNVRLIACVTSVAGAELQPDQLRRALSARLPDYMVPQEVRIVPELPRTLAGKIDREAIATLLCTPDERTGSPGGIDAPRSETESMLAAIWAEVLGLEEVGVHENFFELGGDSLLSIRILARARKAGLMIDPETFFDKPTVAQQASAASVPRADGNVPAAQGGDAPLMPIQRWFFEQIRVDPQHWNQHRVLRVPVGLDERILKRAVCALAEHHDALRACFPCTVGGRTQSFSIKPQAIPVLTVDCSHQGDEGALRDAAARLQQGMNVERGPLVHFLLALDGDRSPLLVIIAHHLVLDGLSWRILTEDLEAVCRGIMQGKSSALPPTTAVAEWSRRLASAAQVDVIQRQAHYWTAIVTGHDTALPAATGDREDNVEGRTERLRRRLDNESTSRLYNAAARPLGATVYEILLAALASVVRRWSGRSSTLIDLEGHGREALFPDVDVSRTVGWLTTVFPWPLTASTEDLMATLAETQRAIRSLPLGGLGFGVLRAYAEDSRVRRSLEQAPSADLCFNYLGGEERAPAGVSFVPVVADLGHDRSPACRRAYLLEINAWRQDGRLVVEWSYCPALHDTETVSSLAGRFEETVLALLAQPEATVGTEFSAGDFPLSGLSPEDMTRLGEILKRRQEET